MEWNDTNSYYITQYVFEKIPSQYTSGADETWDTYESCVLVALVLLFTVALAIPSQAKSLRIRSISFESLSRPPTAKI
jgi:hypothetical protein